MFNIYWFQKHQKILLWMLNAPIVRVWFRWAMNIEDKHKIDCFQPNNYKYWMERWHRCSKNKKEGDHSRCTYRNHHFRGSKQEAYFCFYTYNKYSKKIATALYPVWLFMHLWDYFADAFAPSLSFGFASFGPLNPAAGTGGPTGDATFYATGPAAWATIIAAAGTGALNSSLTQYAILMSETADGTQWNEVDDAGFTFDLTSLAGGTAFSGTFSIYGNTKTDSGTAVTPDINVYNFTPATNYNFAASNYAQCGSTAYSTAITYANFSTAGYNDFAFNATGNTALGTAAGGIFKICTRNANYVVAAIEPTRSAGATHNINIYFADNGSNEPKLAGTYTPGVSAKKKSLFMTGVGS